MNTENEYEEIGRLYLFKLLNETCWKSNENNQLSTVAYLGYGR